MTLATSAAALLTLVRAYNSGGTFYGGAVGVTNSSFGDWSVLDAQGVPQSAVVSVGGPSVSGDEVIDRHGETYGEYRMWQEEHTLTLTIAYRRGVGFGGDGLLETNLTTLVDAVRAWLVTYGQMNAATNVRKMRPTATSAPYDVLKRQDDLLGFARAQDITVMVWCEYAPTYVEIG